MTSVRLFKPRLLSARFRRVATSWDLHFGQPPHIHGNQTVHGCHRMLSAAPVPPLIYKSPLRDIEIPKAPFLADHVFERWSSYGDKVALVDGATDQTTTYNELRAQITRIGSALFRAGFRKGDVMTIFMPNRIEYINMFWGASSIGMTVSTINPQYTTGELQHALEFSNTKVLVVCKDTAEVLRQVLPRTPVQKVVCIDGSEGFEPMSSVLADDGSCFPDHVDYDSQGDVAMLPYSSGTTGVPKGVMLTSYSLVANIEQMTTPEMLGYTPDDVFLCVLPMFHGYALIAIMMNALRCGSSIVLSRKFDPIEFLQDVQKHKATFLHVVPPIMVLMAKHPLMDKSDFGSVRSIVCAAAPVAPNITAEARDRMVSKPVITQGYGMTEASPALSLSPSDRTRAETVGVTVHNTYVKVMDVTTGELLGPNQEGELCFKGPQIMKGYLNNPEATAKTIVDGWLHTGDVGFIDKDGYVTITDRLKELIKYKGYQVAPAELEALLLTHPAVADCAVIGIADEAAGEIPRAYVTLKAEHSATEEDIQNYIKDKAAPQKQLRGGVEFRPAIPKSPSGKILRRVLKDELNETRKP